MTSVGDVVVPEEAEEDFSEEEEEEEEEDVAASSGQKSPGDQGTNGPPYTQAVVDSDAEMEEDAQAESVQEDVDDAVEEPEPKKPVASRRKPPATASRFIDDIATESGGEGSDAMSEQDDNKDANTNGDLATLVDDEILFDSDVSESEKAKERKRAHAGDRTMHRQFERHQKVAAARRRARATEIIEDDLFEDDTEKSVPPPPRPSPKVAAEPKPRSTSGRKVMSNFFEPAKEAPKPAASSKKPAAPKKPAEDVVVKQAKPNVSAKPAPPPPVSAPGAKAAAAKKPAASPSMKAPAKPEASPRASEKKAAPSKPAAPAPKPSPSKPPASTPAKSPSASHAKKSPANGSAPVASKESGIAAETPKKRTREEDDDATKTSDPKQTQTHVKEAFNEALKGHGFEMVRAGDQPVNLFDGLSLEEARALFIDVVCVLTTKTELGKAEKAKISKRSSYILSQVNTKIGRERVQLIMTAIIDFLGPFGGHYDKRYKESEPHEMLRAVAKVSKARGLPKSVSSRGGGEQQQQQHEVGDDEDYEGQREEDQEEAELGEQDE